MIFVPNVFHWHKILFGIGPCDMFTTKEDNYPIHKIMKQSVQYSESELLIALKLCKREAFEYFYDLYAPVLYGMVLKITKEEKTAQSLMLDVFSELLREIKNYDPGSQTMLCWALVIARIVACEHNNKVNKVNPICD